MNAKPSIDLGADGPAATSRLTRDAVHRGKPVGRAVASDPLDHYAVAGQLTERQHEAGMRLRVALSGSWPAERVTATPMYASDPSPHDEESEPQSEDDEWKAQTQCWRDRRDAEKFAGSLWGTVRAVCEGRWASGVGGLRALQLGLEAVADGWKMERR